MRVETYGLGIGGAEPTYAASVPGRQEPSPAPVARRFDAVLFDFSGVLVASAFEAMRGVGGAHADGDRVLAILLGPYDADTDHPWHRVERGELDLGSWMREVSAMAAAEGVALDFGVLSAWAAELSAHPEMVALARDAKEAGLATALVTNNVKEGSDTWRKLLPLDDLFDVVVDSSEVGFRKPDARIFELTLQRLGGVAPERALFLDDHPGNIAGAERAGLHGLLVTDPATAAAEVREQLGLPAGTSPLP